MCLCTCRAANADRQLGKMQEQRDPDDQGGRRLVEESGGGGEARGEGRGVTQDRENWRRKKTEKTEKKCLTQCVNLEINQEIL